MLQSAFRYYKTNAGRSQGGISTWRDCSILAWMIDIFFRNRKLVRFFMLFFQIFKNFHGIKMGYKQKDRVQECYQYPNFATLHKISLLSGWKDFEILIKCDMMNENT